MRNWGSRREKNRIFNQTVPPGIDRKWRVVPIFIIILAFLFNLLIPSDLAWAKTTDTMPSPIGEEPSVGPGHTFLAPRDIEIPPAFGTIKETFQQDTEPKGLVVHIQDLHTHYEAHKNIAGIIKHLAEKHGMNIVLCEAKSTDKGLAFLRPWVDKEILKDVAEEKLKEGILTGWEALDLTSELDLTLQGIEDKDLYMKDMDYFLKAESVRPEALKFVSILENITDNLKMKMYKGGQRTFDEKISFYRDEKIEIADYANYLVGLSKRYDLEYEKFVNLGILLETLRLEGDIDFKGAEREREMIIDILAKGLAENDMKALLDKSIEFKSNRISQNEFYQYLVTLCRKSDIDTKRYPHFNLYTKYIATYHELNASKLFEEINNLEDFLAEALFTKEDQKRLFQISKNLIILRGLVDFKLTPDEFDYYNATKTGFDMKDWLEFLRLNSEYFKLTQFVPDDASIIEDNLDTFENFYKVAHKRDEAFVKNIDEQFTKRGIDSAILATGGFHTPGVTRRLKETGYSYVVIAPRIEEDMDYEKYHEILKDSYLKLRDEAVIGAWSASEIEVRVAAILQDLLDQGAVRLAEEGTWEHRMLALNNRLALRYSDGTVAIMPGLESIDLLRVLAGATSERARELLENLRAAEKAATPERPQVYDQARRDRHETVGTTTDVDVHDGVVAVFWINDAGDVVGETETLLAPQDGATAEAGVAQVAVRPAEPSPEGVVVIGARDTLPELIEDFEDRFRVSRVNTDEIRETASGHLQTTARRIGKNICVRLNADSIVGTSDPEEARRFIEAHREELTEYLAFIAANVYEWRKISGNRRLVFFDFEGTDAIVGQLAALWQRVPIVANNQEFMRLQHHMHRREMDYDYTETQVASIRDAGLTAMSIDNPTLFLQQSVPTPDGEGLNWFDWETGLLLGYIVTAGAQLAGEIVAAADTPALGREALLAQIRQDKGDKETIFGIIAAALARVARIDTRDITPEMIAVLVHDYKDYQEEAARYIEEKLNPLNLSMKVIKAYSFREIREIFTTLKELIRSI